MRRSPAFILTMALMASVLGAVSFSAASAVVMTPPGDTADTGNLYADPVTFTTGQKIKLTANFPSTYASREVTYYKQTGPDTWTVIGTDQSNSSGNAYLTNYAVDGAQEVYARVTSGSLEGRTEVDTLTPEVIAPTGPDVGSLYQDPATFSDGDTIALTANFPNGTFDITLYEETAPDVWSAIGTKRSSKSGNATFTGYQVNGTTRLFARKGTGERTEVDTIAPSPDVHLDIQRDCTGNTCGDTASVTGRIDPVQAGRVFTLQYQSGSTWTQIGDSGTTGADGKVTFSLDLTGLPQWTVRSYRLVSEADETNPPAVSPTIQFMPGPTELGKNVLRVDVEDGIFPTKKGPEYPATATASQGGVVNPKIKNVAVEEFGVRGTSTAGYTKKPYKLKFDKSPKDTTVFGMGADKSWTLLATYLDQSFVRDKVGLDLGRRINEDGRWTPDSRFVELFVNDQYRGSYLMTESVKIDGDRVNVDKEKGMIMEVDNALSSAEDFMSTIGKIVFAFKDPDERKTLDDGSADPESVTDEKFSAVKSRINAFEKKLYSSSGRDEYEDFINEEAAIDFNFIKEFTKDNDSDFNSSHYFSWNMDPAGTSTPTPLDDGKFHFGPAWDFDRSAGNVDPDTAGHKYVSSPTGWMLRGTGTPSDSGRQLYKTHWFVQLFKDPGFNAAVKARWTTVRDEFEKVHLSEITTLKAEIGVGALNDRARWKNEPKRYRSHGSFDEEIAFVTKWYRDRFEWMDAQLS